MNKYPWRPRVVILIGLWLIISPFILNAPDSLKWSMVISGIVIIILALV